MTISQQVTLARDASRRLAVSPESTRNAILEEMRNRLLGRQNEILSANAADATAAEQSGLAAPLYKRLVLSEKKLGVMAESLRSVAALADPIGSSELERELDEGLILERVRVPIGVVGVIFESRPDALVQIGSLAIKSGNAALLKGGSEARETNRVLHTLFAEAIRAVDPALEGALALVETREEIKTMLGRSDDIDLMIPRGSNELVRFIQENTRIPVLGHADGICHVFIDAGADAEMSVRITRDAKTQYPAVCNAVETLLVHSDSVARLPAIVDSMPEVEFRGCERSRAAVEMAVAEEVDWVTEYTDLVLSVRVVDSVEEAIDHINRYGSHHTDAIVTADAERAGRFMGSVDSSSVLWNASTRFADGF